ncbi:amidase [Microbacterium sp. ASV81]|uniref:Amidase family protein n=1 Tax=Microbacterium capsulatum TaxID=3041921 RepID=A0ABU0XES8_9MICO|nr:amidase family protein [Microbacterium sp. ASV81]MDQ4213612.1 amidase family protein [Microbacterium sp. ASV81]
MVQSGEIIELSAKEQARLTRSGELTAVELLDAHLAEVGRRNPEINAIVALDEELAHAHARRVDALPAERRGVLHGVPTAVKDFGHVTGFPNTLGHRHFADSISDHDDLHVARMRAEGAVFYGKTNIPEVAAGSHSVNRVYGTTRNPHDPSRSAGGSSGGAAAALAANFTAIADGSDMGGSLRNPAGFCGVVGMRPTPGVVPNADSPNVFDPLATAGPMARTIDDTALLLSVMNGETRDVPCAPVLDRARLLDLRERDLSGVRIAYAPDLGGLVEVEPAIRAVLDDVARSLEGAGAIVEEGCPDLRGSDETFRTLRAAVFASAWGPLLEAEPENFNDFVTGNIREGALISGADVMRAYTELTRLTRAAAHYFTGTDLVLAPVTQVLPFPVEWDWVREVNGTPMTDYLDWMRAAWLFTPLGVPALSLPAGYAGHLPVGAQLVAGPRRDVELLELARAIESLLAVPAANPVATSVAG